MEVTSKNFLTIQGWMRTELDLSGSELLMYALIYGFAQEEQQWCTCSLNYMTYWLGLSNRQRTREVLQRLIDKGLVLKQEYYSNNVKFCRYQTSHTVSKKATPVAERATPPVAERATNKDSIYNTINTDNPPIVPQGTCKRDTLADEKAMFDIFRRTYRGTKRGLDTEFSNFIKKHKDWREVLPTLSDLYAKQCEQLDRNKLTGGFVPQPKNLQTYINQRCWEEEVQPTTPTQHGHRQVNSKFADPDETRAAIAAGINAGLTELGLGPAF